VALTLPIFKVLICQFVRLNQQLS